MATPGAFSTRRVGSLPVPRLGGARLRFVLRSCALLARYPSVAVRLPDGLGTATAAMEEKVVQSFVRSPQTFGRIGGARVRLNPRNTLPENAAMAVAGWYEPPISEILTSLCRPGACVVDVGANVGWYTFLAAQRVGPTGRVLAFEPEPENFALLSESLRDNPRPQVRVWAEAVSDHDGEETLFLSDEAASFHSTARHVGTRSLTVRSLRIDTVVHDLALPSVDVLKIDVEGGEPKVLRGALDSLRAGRVRNLLIEWRSETWEAEKPLWEEIAARYRVYRILMRPRLVEEIPDPTLERVHAAMLAVGRHGRNLFLAGGAPD